MNVSFFIARRYLVSKKSHTVINIISLVSMIGVLIGTMSLVIVLSVFNGFENLVVSLFNTFNPDMMITLKEGKTFPSTNLDENRLRSLPGVINLVEVLEENALVKYRDKQYIVTVKGVGEQYAKTSRLDTMMAEGHFVLQTEDKDFAVLGYGVAYYLNANLQDFTTPLTVYVPRRDASFSGIMDNAFNSESIFPSGYFSVQQDYDTKYMIVPLRFAKKLLEYDKEISGIEITLDPKSDHARLQEQIAETAGSRFTVKNRFQQEEILYKIMKSEKWAIFLILAFILFIATFNVIGSLSILILDKKKDIAVLKSMGAGDKLVQRIFLLEGSLISVAGAIGGLILGALICWLQQAYGFVKLGSPDSTFVVDAYPVSMKAIDFAVVFVTVIAIGILAAWYPVYNIRKIDTTAVKLH